MSEIKSQVFNEDCMIGMAQYPDKYFELAIVDPPYGINASKITHYNSDTINKLTVYKPKKWDEHVPKSEYFKELFRISKNQIIWGGNYFSDNLPPSRNWLIWDKGVPEGMSYSQAELCWINIGKGVKIFQRNISKDQNRVSNNVNKAKGYLRIHPTQKPIALYKWLLKNYAKPGDKILDTHLGSGSSRIAAFDGGFDFTGYEIDKEYFDDSVKRFQNHISQLKLELV